MLNELDKELCFTRYADDCIILVGSSKAVDRVMENVSKFIEKKLGFNEDTSKMWANSRKSYARCALSFLQFAIPNQLLKKRGLVTILDQYQLRHIYNKFVPSYAER